MSGLEKKIEKKRVLVVVDIDETLMMPKLRVEGPPWIGGLVGHDTWVTGFQSLFDRLKASGVEVHFAVITNKPYLDDLIFEVANAFAGLLDLNHPYSHVVQEDLSQEKRFRLCSQVIDISGPTGDAVYVPLDPFGRGQVVPGLVGCSSFSPYEQTPDLPKTPKVICFYPPGRFDLLKFPQVVHWDPRTYQGFLTKADAMKKIADEHGINARDCYLIDNTESILESVLKAGMSPVSATSFDFLKESKLPRGYGLHRCWYDGVYQAQALDHIRDILVDLSTQLERRGMFAGAVAAGSGSGSGSGAGAGAGSALSSPTNSVGSLSSESFEGVLGERDLSEASARLAKSHGPAQVFYEILYELGFNKAALDKKVYKDALGIFAR